MVSFQNWVVHRNILLRDGETEAVERDFFSLPSREAAVLLAKKKGLSVFVPGKLSMQKRHCSYLLVLIFAEYDKYAGIKVTLKVDT